jgi:hypothetical protein
MKWSKERDNLIAQTLAFVQSVSGRRPEPAPELVEVKPAPIRPPLIENPFAELASTPAADPAPVKTVAPTESVAKVESVSDLPAAPAQSDVRREIQSRVAAFQAHQHRFHREREAYFNSVLTKARSTIDHDPDAPTS